MTAPRPDEQRPASLPGTGPGGSRWDGAEAGGARPGGGTDERGEARLRVSDAERQDVASLLGRHFADGRLDEEELDERVGAAMRATTRGDLAVLLVDLPRLDPVPRAVRPPRRSRRPAAVALALALLAPPAASLLAGGHASRVAPPGARPTHGRLLPERFHPASHLRHVTRGDGPGFRFVVPPAAAPPARLPPPAPASP